MAGRHHVLTDVIHLARPYCQGEAIIWKLNLQKVDYKE